VKERTDIVTPCNLLLGSQLKRAKIAIGRYNVSTLENSMRFDGSADGDSEHLPSG
jgi:hypothetical protein